MDFTVDIDARTARHSSGASASFYPYLNDDDWRRSDVVFLYDGPATELAYRAKAAALEAGMGHSGTARLSEPSDDPCAERPRAAAGR